MKKQYIVVATLMVSLASNYIMAGPHKNGNGKKQAPSTEAKATTPPPTTAPVPPTATPPLEASSAPQPSTAAPVPASLTPTSLPVPPTVTPPASFKETDIITVDSNGQEQALKIRYSHIEWNPENIWDTIPEAVVPTQVAYFKQVNYEVIADTIEKCNPTDITPEKKTRLQHDAENAVRDLIGALDYNIQKYPATADLVEHMAPKITLLAKLANKANQLGIMSAHNTKQAAAWLKKYDGYVIQLKDENDKRIAAYRKEISEIAKKLGFTNEITRALESLTHLDPAVVNSNRVAVETQVGSLLTALTAKVQVSTLDEASTLISYAHTIINESESLGITISRHQLNAVQDTIRHTDKKIAQELDKQIKTSLLLRQKNKNARKKVHSLKNNTYKTSDDEQLSDNEYENAEDVAHILESLSPEKVQENK